MRCRSMRAFPGLKGERGRRKKEVRQGTREQMMGGEKERSENCFYTKAQATEASYR